MRCPLVIGLPVMVIWCAFSHINRATVTTNCRASRALAHDEPSKWCKARDALLLVVKGGDGVYNIDAI